MGDAIRSLLTDSSSHHRPKQLAAAVAFGLLCGLLPKESLLFWLVGMTCCFLPIHLPLAALVIAGSSLANSAVTAFAGELGKGTLTQPWLIDFWIALDRLPWVPWLSLNNSVVLGSLILGLALWLPVFGLAYVAFARVFRRSAFSASEALDRDFIHKVAPAVGMENPSLPIQRPVEVSFEKSAPIATTRSSPLTVEMGDTIDEETCSELQALLSTCHREEEQPLTTAQVALRAAQVAEFVDDLLTSCLDDYPSGKASPRPQSLLSDSDATPMLCAGDDRVISYQDQTVDPISLYDQTSDTMPLSPSASTLFVQSQHIHDMSSGDESSVARRHDSRHRTLLSEADEANSALYRSPATGSDLGSVAPVETLRYLLHHLKAIKDKV